MKACKNLPDAEWPTKDPTAAPPETFIALVLHPSHTTAVNTKCLRVLQATLPSITIKCLWTQSMSLPEDWCLPPRPSHDQEKSQGLPLVQPHSYPVPVKGNNQWHINIIIQYQTCLYSLDKSNHRPKASQVSQPRDTKVDITSGPWATLPIIQVSQPWDT